MNYDFIAEHGECAESGLTALLKQYASNNSQILLIYTTKFKCVKFSSIEDIQHLTELRLFDESCPSADRNVFQVAVHKRRKVPFFRMNDKAVIPGSSLRGVIRNVYETLTNSCLSCINDTEKDFFSSRINKNKTGLLEYQNGKYILYDALRFKIVTEYFAPDSAEFCGILSSNLKSKLLAAQYPFSSDFSIKLLNTPRKVVTRFKKIWVTAYSGRFRLEGAPETLNFLYNVGLGQRSSEGVGMFDVI